MADAELTLVIETQKGIAVRRIPTASPLPPHIGSGRAAEDATQDAATVWGLPDFLYHAEIHRVGAGTREVGDRLLVVGDLGLVVQVKSRELPGADESKEHRWLEKHSARGVRQAHGTIRRLRARATTLTNARGRSIEVDGTAIRWIAVVVIDHAAPPDGFTPDVSNQPNPTVVLLRRDWEFLFDQLKSTYWVASYFERVAAEGAIALGEEPLRYYDLAQADEAARPRPVPKTLLGKHGRSEHAPLLPYAPTGATDERPFVLLRAIVEDIARAGLSGPIDEGGRLKALAALDRLPVSAREDIGRFLVEATDFVSSPPKGQTVWRQRRFVSEALPPPLQLGFAACSHEWDDMIRDVFSWWLQLRHYEIAEALGGVHDLTSVGVLLTPRSTRRYWPWDTSLLFVSGDLKLDEERLAAYRTMWPLEKGQETAAGL
jgi:hypothetical protein